MFVPVATTLANAGDVATGGAALTPFIIVPWLVTSTLDSARDSGEASKTDRAAFGPAPEPLAAPADGWRRLRPSADCARPLGSAKERRVPVIRDDGARSACRRLRASADDGRALVAVEGRDNVSCSANSGRARPADKGRMRAASEAVWSSWLRSMLLRAGEAGGGESSMAKGSAARGLSGVSHGLTPERFSCEQIEIERLRAREGIRRGCRTRCANGGQGGEFGALGRCWCCSSSKTA